MIINVREPKTMVFGVTVDGVEPSQIKGSFVITLKGVDFGFPIRVSSDEKMVVEIPALESVVEEIEKYSTGTAKLSLTAEDYYFEPYEDGITLEQSINVDAKLLDVFGKIASDKKVGMTVKKTVLKPIIKISRME